MFTISEKKDLSLLAHATKKILEHNFQFPIKLSRSREATAQLIAGSSHQSLLKNLPYEVSAYNIDALSQYIKKVHQKALDLDPLRQLGDEGLTDLLFTHSPAPLSLRREISPIRTDTILCLFGIYAAKTPSGFEEEINHSNKSLPPSLLIDELEKKFETNIIDFKAQMIPSGIGKEDYILEFLADLSLSPAPDPEAIRQIDVSRMQYLSSDSTEESWVLELPKFTLAIAIKVPINNFTPHYELFLEHEGMLSALSDDICENMPEVEFPLCAEASYLPIPRESIEIDLNEYLGGKSLDYLWELLPESAMAHALGDDIHDDKSFNESTAGFCSTERGIKIIEKILENGNVEAISIPISTTDDSWGEFGFFCLFKDQAPLLAMNHYETFSCAHAEMSMSSHHFEGHYLRDTFPNIKCYSIAPCSDGMTTFERALDYDWGMVSLFNKEEIKQLLKFKPQKDDDYQEDYTQMMLKPSLFNGFNELIKHWVASDINPFDVSIYSDSKPIFVTYKDKLIEAGLDFIQVSDFQEPFGDYSSILTVALYAKEVLLAEISYAVMLGAGSKQDPIEWKLDKAIKQFAESNSITLRTHDYAVFHPTASRHLSFYNSENTLLPLPRENSIKKSMLLMIVNVQGPSEDEVCHIEPLNLYNHCHKLLRNNATRNGETIPLFFTLLTKPNKVIFNDHEITLLVDTFEHAIKNNTKIVPDISSLSDGFNTRGKLTFYAAFDLAGKPIDEVNGMINSMGAHYRYKKQYTPDTTDEFTLYWSSMPNYGDSFFVSEENLAEWECALGYAPPEVEFTLLNVLPALQ